MIWIAAHSDSSCREPEREAASHSLRSHRFENLCHPIGRPTTGATPRFLLLRRELIITNQPETAQDCIALSFYSIQAAPVCIAAFYTDVIEWFNEVAGPPDTLAVNAPGFSGRHVGFARAHLRLSKEGFAHVKSFDIHKMREGQDTALSDWLCNVCVRVDRKPTFVLESLSSICTLEDPRLNHIVTSCIKHLNPLYGIGYHCHRDRGPAFYAIGINYSPRPELAVAHTEEAYEAKLNVSRWGDLGMVEEVYREGYLRDVYPYNYLSSPQLKKRVGEQTLQEWIILDQSRGTLNQLSDRITLWKVDESQLNSVRAQLSATGIFFDWKNYLDE